ncbi:MAG: hypothetical protein RML56_14210 [Burkholderiales bacterium]|nr:hypothetical protein [Burkholderiales bacterium]
MLLLEDYQPEVLDEDAIRDFSERQFAETSWIAKRVAQWMRTICRNVSVSRGALTAHLRRIWKLDTVIAQARYEANLPVLDTEGQPISRSDFERFRPFWEGHTSSQQPGTDRKIDKRIDHRHHLIDALVVAQVSRSLYQQMAREYKALSEQRHGARPVRLRLQAPPPLPDVREKALELVRNAVIRHKPDRWPSGAFFQDYAYAKVLTEAGKTRLARRIPVADLADSTAERTRRNICDIVSPATREIVLEAFETRLAAGKSVKEALAEPIPDPRFGSRGGSIKRVRVYLRSGRGYADGDSAVAIRHESRQGNLCKHLISDGYAYVAIRTENGKIVSAESVSLYAAASGRMPREGELTFYRGDTLLDPKSGRHYLIHQILANATVRAAPVIEARGWIELQPEAGRVQFGAAALCSMERL